jgi:hypothetical protein
MAITGRSSDRCGHGVVAVDPVEHGQYADPEGEEFVTLALHLPVGHVEQVAVPERGGLDLRSTGLTSRLVTTARRRATRRVDVRKAPPQHRSVLDGLSWPKNVASCRSSEVTNSVTQATWFEYEYASWSTGLSERPKPMRSGTMTRCPAATSVGTIVRYR